MATYNQISYGSKGDEVKELQTLLNNNDYKLDVDGSFGPKTLAAVKDYQTKNGLKVDGIVGTNTWGALTKANSSSASSASTPKFEYADYAPSDAVTNAQTMLNQHLAQKPGEYQSAWQTQLNDAINKIMNREKFSYDLNGDALYQQYKDMYTTQGKMAMMDTMGQAAAATGGYGNSYAQSVGQQAYQGYLQQLNDKVPELYSLAYDRYNQEGQDLLNQYSLLSAQEEKDYGRHRDTVSDWQTERGYLTDSYNNERTYDRSIYDSDRGFAYQLDRDEKEDEQWEKSFDEGVRQFNESQKKKIVDDFDYDDDPDGDPKKVEKYIPPDPTYSIGPNGNTKYYNPNNIKAGVGEGGEIVFTGSTYGEAISFIKHYGGYYDGLIPVKEFKQAQMSGSSIGGESLKNMTYADYLKEYCKYAIN